MMATDDSLKKFWEIEKVAQTKAWSASETKAEADTGRFIVDLPKSNPLIFLAILTNRHVIDSLHKRNDSPDILT